MDFMIRKFYSSLKFSGWLTVMGLMAMSINLYAASNEELQQGQDHRSDQQNPLVKQAKSKPGADQKQKKYIYQWQDENGNTVISDKPHLGALAIPLPQAQIISPPRPPTVQFSAPGTQNGNNTIEQGDTPQLNIVSPAKDSWLENNVGEVTIKVSVKPSLTPGLILQILLDGKIVNAHNSPSVILKNLARGEHSIIARVRRESSQKILRSTQSSFFVRRPIIKRH